MSIEKELRDLFGEEGNYGLSFSVREIAGRDNSKFYEVIDGNNKRLAMCNDRKYAALFSLAGKLWSSLVYISQGYSGLIDEINSEFDSRVKGMEAKS